MFLGLLLIQPSDTLASERQRIDTAVLVTADGEREVRLPHALEPSDFPPDGGRVRYRLQVPLDDTDTAQGIHIGKMSRAGRLFLNGEAIGSCGLGALERLRCLHQPQFFSPPRSLWIAGPNRLEVEILATRSQTNGLSAVLVGPEEALFREVFRADYLWRVELIDVLSWMALGMGLLALLTYWALRDEPLYLWFGLTCLTNVASNLNILATAPPFPFPLVDWFMFASRLVFTCFLGITMLTFFGRAKPYGAPGLVIYAVAACVAIWLFGNDPQRISLLYLPLQAIAVVLAIAAFRWARRSGKRSQWTAAMAFAVNPCAGVLDLMRLRGEAAFDGVYWLVYTSVASLVIVGLSLLGALALALRQSRSFATTLQRTVARREAELTQAYDRILAAEAFRARGEERERIIRDMHDGFMSTLALTRIALDAGRITLRHAARLVRDCQDDLRLVLEATGNTSGSLKELLVDFLHRIRPRLEEIGIEETVELDLDGMPAMSSTALLQVMRIVQEAVNNAIRHSGAQRLGISASWRAADATLRVCIADEGRGMPTERPSQGRGLSNMRGRAHALGGRLEIASNRPGTRVLLEVPLAAPLSSKPARDPQDEEGGKSTSSNQFTVSSEA